MSAASPTSPESGQSASVALASELPLAHPEIIALYARDVDHTLLREILKLTPAQRAEKFMARLLRADDIRDLARSATSDDTPGGPA